MDTEPTNNPSPVETSQTTWPVKRWLGLVILAMWGISLVCPTVSITNSGKVWGYGWGLLLIGWTGLLMGIPAWFANFPLVSIGIALFKRKQPPMWLGFVTAALASTALFWGSIGSENGSTPIAHYFIGYWLWILAAWLCMFATITVGDESPWAPTPTRRFGND